MVMLRILKIFGWYFINAVHIGYYDLSNIESFVKIIFAILKEVNYNIYIYIYQKKIRNTNTKIITKIIYLWWIFYKVVLYFENVSKIKL